MMNSLDSRFLQPGDCFGQRFPTPGVIRCYIAPSSHYTAIAADRGDFVIEVATKPSTERAAAPKQVNVAVKSDGNGSVKVDSERITIDAGDGVMFYTADPHVTGFAVAGVGPNFRFDSARMQNGAVFTHAFGTPGTHAWVDPVNGKVAGVVEVKDVAVKTPEHRDAWLELLKKPAAFEISGASCKPASVEIVVGQTVFWSVTDSPGVGITDKRLLNRHDVKLTHAD